MSAAKKLVDKKTLKSLVPISALAPHHFNDIANKVQVEEIPAGRFVFKEGDRDGWTVYLIAGEVTLLAANKAVGSVIAGTDAARYAIAAQQPRKVSCRAKTNVSIARIDTGLLDVLLTAEESAGYEVNELQAEDDDDWMTRMLQSQAFLRLPPANIQKLLMSMEHVPAQAGEVIIKQGDPGDYYYIIKSGRCAVTRKASSSAQEVKLAELSEGASFGEDALVSDAERNATVTMLTDGHLMRLSKTDFVALLKEPLLSQVNYRQALSLADDGAAWLDIRLPGEYKAAHVAGSINIPLSALRHRVDELDPERRYIVCCDSAERSSTAAFVLGQRGFDAYMLAGGILQLPPDALEGTDVAAQIRTAQGAAVPEAADPTPPAADVISFDAGVASKKKAEEARRNNLSDEGDAQAASAAWQQAEQEASHLIAEAQAARLRAQQEAERIRQQAESEAAKIMAQADAFLKSAQEETHALNEKVRTAAAKTEEQRAKFTELQEQLREKLAQAESESDRTRAALAEAERRADEQAQRAESAVRTAEEHAAALAKLEAAGAATRDRIAQLEAALQQARDDATAAAQGRAESAEALARSERAVSDLQAQVHEREQDQGRARELETERKRLQQALEQASLRIAELEQAVRGSDEARQSAESGVVELQAAIERAEHERADALATLKSETSALHARIEQLSTQATETEQQRQSAEQRVAALDAELAAARAAVEQEAARLEEKSASMRAKLELARDQMLEASRAKQDLLAAKEAADLRVEELQADLARARAADTEEVRTLKEQLERVTKEREASAEQLRQAARLRGELDEVRREGEQRVARLQSELESVHATAQQQLADLESQNADLKYRLARASEQNSGAQRRQEELERAAHTAERELEELRAQRAQADAGTQARIAELESETAALREDLARADALSADTERARAQMEEEADTLRAQRAALAGELEQAGAAHVEEVAALRIAAADLETRRAQLETQAAAAEQSRAALETDLAAARAGAEDLRAELERAVAIAQQVAVLEEQLATERRRAEEAHDAAAGLRAEHDRERGASAARIEELQAQLQRVRSDGEERLAELDHSNAALQSALDELRTQTQQERDELNATIERMRIESEEALSRSGEEAMRSVGAEMTALREELARARQDAQHEAAQLREELQEAHTIAKHERERMARADAALRDAEQAAQALKTELQGTERQLNETLTLVDAAEEARQQAELEVTHLKRREDQLMREAQGALERTAHEAESRLHDEIERLRTELQSAQRDAQGREHELHAEVHRLQEKLQAGEVLVRDEVAKATAEADISKCYLEEEVTRLSAELEEARAHLEEEGNLRRAAENARKAAQQQADKLRAEAQVMKSLAPTSVQPASTDGVDAAELARLNDELALVKKNVETAVRLRGESDAARIKLAEEADALRQRVAEMANDAEDARARAGQAEQAQERLREELENAQSAAQGAVRGVRAAPRKGGGVLGFVLGAATAAAVAATAFVYRDAWMPLLHGTQASARDLVSAAATAPSPAAPQAPAPEVSNEGTVARAVQEEPQAPALRPGRRFRDSLIGGGSGPLMVEVPAGAMQMGSGSNSLNFDERPQHEVNLRGFAIGVHEVTFADYEQFARATGRAVPHDAGWGRGERPVINVDWEDAGAYARWLSEQSGHRYRLPGEAEWEYAAGAGAQTFYWWGNGTGSGNANCFNCGSEWDGSRTAPVGRFKPNALGLHDTAGNVLEWVRDCYHGTYEGAPADGSAWVEGDCSRRIARGGSYANPIDNLRTQKRSHYAPDTRLDNLGFRVVRAD